MRYEWRLVAIGGSVCVDRSQVKYHDVQLAMQHGFNAMRAYFKRNPESDGIALEIGAAS